MQELIVKTQRPIIEANFEAVKQQLIDGLKTYDVIITAETVKDGKAMASEINKIKKAIKDQEKKALEEILGPSNEFKEKIKELMDLADEARDKITEQVEAYEQKTRDEIEKKIDDFANEEIEKANLRYPFTSVKVSDLVKLTAITKTGNLTSATIETIKGRVAEQKNLQLEDDARIAREQKERDEEIARIRDEERAKAQAEVHNVHVTIEQPIMQQQTMTQEEYDAIGMDDVIEYQCENEFIPDHDPITGEVYEEPAYMEEQPTANKVIITAEFEVDITKIPNVTNEQLINAIQNRLKKADVNNATIVAIKRF